MTTEVREVHTGWSTHNDLPDTYMAYAECADEITQMILMNPTPEMRAMFLIPPEDMRTSTIYLGLLDDHKAQCSACQAWYSAPR